MEAEWKEGSDTGVSYTLPDVRLEGWQRLRDQEVGAYKWKFGNCYPLGGIYTSSDNRWTRVYEDFQANQMICDEPIDIEEDPEFGCDEHGFIRMMPSRQKIQETLLSLGRLSRSLGENLLRSESKTLADTAAYLCASESSEENENATVSGKFADKLYDDAYKSMFRTARTRLDTAVFTVFDSIVDPKPPHEKK